MTPDALASLIAGMVPAPEAVDESVLPQATLQASLADPEQLAAWRALVAEPPGYLDRVTIMYSAFDAPLDPDAAPSPDELFRITLLKRAEPGELRLFFGAGLAKHAEATGTVDHIRIADLGDAEDFDTERGTISLWTEQGPAQFIPKPPLTNPRSLVSDLTERSAVPSDLRPWLLRREPAKEGEAFRAWRRLAAPRLLAALSDRVMTDNEGHKAFYLAGPPSVTVTPDDAALSGWVSVLAPAASWVYVEGAGDAETRHTLLSAEWARSFRRGPQAAPDDAMLESARSAYQAYVRSSSRDTLKAIADLRSAVLDETQKISQRAQDLAGSLWKDLAVAAAPFVLKILPDAARAPTLQTTGWLAGAAAIFLAFSFAVQSFVNWRWIRHQRQSRKSWALLVNTVLTPDEVSEYRDKPISASECTYWVTWGAVAVVYFVLIVILVLFAHSNFEQASAVAAQSTPHEQVQNNLSAPEKEVFLTAPTDRSLPQGIANVGAAELPAENGD